MPDPQHSVQCRQLAALVSTGATQEAMQTELGLTKGAVRRLLADPLTQRYVEEMGEEITKTALLQIRKDIARMTGLALKALEANLRKNSMEAVKTLFKVAGALDSEEKAAPEQSLTVIMPGATAKVETVVELPQGDYGSPTEPKMDS